MEYEIYTPYDPQELETIRANLKALYAYYNEKVSPRIRPGEIITINREGFNVQFLHNGILVRTEQPYSQMTFNEQSDTNGWTCIYREPAAGVKLLLQWHDILEKLLLAIDTRESEISRLMAFHAEPKTSKTSKTSKTFSAEFI